MQVLAKRIMDLDKKKKLKTQIEYIEKQLITVISDLEALNKAIK